MAQTGQGRKARPQERWETITLGELRDSQRFDEFVKCAYARMLSLARQLLGNLDDASDAVQKAFVELHEVVTQRLTEPNAVAVGFMYERVRWRAHDHIRERQRQPISSTEAMGASDSDDPLPDGADALSAQADDAPEIEDIVVAIEKRQDIHTMGKELAGRSREVFELLMKDERPVDIARQLGVAKARVSQLVQIVCAQLRTKLRDKGWECHETMGVRLNF